MTVANIIIIRARSVPFVLVTKLNGKKQPVPVRFIGIGEGLEDLQPFQVAEFVDALFA